MYIYIYMGTIVLAMARELEHKQPSHGVADSLNFADVEDMGV